MTENGRKLAEVRQALIGAASQEVVESTRKFVPSAVKVYGVRLPVINDLARKHKAGGFELVRALWESGAFEERLLAGKLLGLVARRDPEQTLALVEEFSRGISDWAVCDTIGMQSVKRIVKTDETSILELAKRLAASRGVWPQRLGIVLLTHYAKLPARRDAVLQIAAPLRISREHYIKKALEWLDRDLVRHIN